MQVPSGGRPLEMMRMRVFKEMTRNAQVVWVAGHTPPARGEQLGPLLGCHIRQIYSR